MDCQKPRDLSISRLDKSKLVGNGLIPLPDWGDALCRYLHKL